MNSLEEYPGEVIVQQLACHFPSLPIAGLAPVGHAAGWELIQEPSAYLPDEDLPRAEREVMGSDMPSAGN